MLARRLWRDRLPSRALKYLEENILGLPRTAEEVPGYDGLTFGALQRGGEDWNDFLNRMAQDRSML